MLSPILSMPAFLRVLHRTEYPQLCLQAYGDRELLDHEVVGKLTDSSADFLHVYVRLRDVMALNVTGHSRKSIGISQREGTPRSLLTASLAREGSSDGYEHVCTSSFKLMPACSLLLHI